MQTAEPEPISVFNTAVHQVNGAQEAAVCTRTRVSEAPEECSYIHSAWSLKLTQSLVCGALLLTLESHPGANQNNRSESVTGRWDVPCLVLAEFWSVAHFSVNVSSSAEPQGWGAAEMSCIQEICFRQTKREQNYNYPVIYWVQPCVLCAPVCIWQRFVYFFLSSRSWPMNKSFFYVHSTHTLRPFFFFLITCIRKRKQNQTAKKLKASYYIQIWLEVSTRTFFPLFFS